MKWYLRWSIVILSTIILALAVFFFDNKFTDLKDLFFYLNDWPSLIMLLLLLFAVKGIIEWILKWEARSLK